MRVCGAAASAAGARAIRRAPTPSLSPSLLHDPGYVDGTECMCSVDPTPEARAALVAGAAVDVRGVDAGGLPAAWLPARIATVAFAPGVEGGLRFRLVLEGEGGEGGGAPAGGWVPLVAPDPSHPIPTLAVRPRHTPMEGTPIAPGDAVEAADGRGGWWAAAVVTVAGNAATLRVEPSPHAPSGATTTLPLARVRPVPGGGRFGGVGASVGEKVHPDEWLKRTSATRGLLIIGHALDSSTLLQSQPAPPGAPPRRDGLAALVAAAGDPGWGAA